MSNDCSICFEDLGCAQYDPQCMMDTDVSASVFRLSCGHAYHTNCVMRAIRTTRVCPMCRSDGSRTIDTGEDRGTEIVVSSDGQIMIRITEPGLEEGEVEEAMVDVAAIGQAVLDVAAVRSSSPRAQKARRDRNKALKRYADHEGDLIVKRRQVICDALRAFREAERTDFERLRRQTQRDLRRCRAAELDALTRRFGEPRAREMWTCLGLDEAEYDINSRNGLGTRMCPLKHRFWTH